MGMSMEWLIYALQNTSSSLITFNETAGDYFVIPALTSMANAGWEVEEERELGAGRGRDNFQLGALGPSGNWTQRLYTENMIQLFLLSMRDAIKQSDTPSAGDYTYGLLHDDSLGMKHFSAQQIYKDTVQYASDALALSILAGVPTQWTIEAAQKSSARFTLNWIAKDLAVSTDDSAGDSKVWHYGDGTTNTPDVIDVTSLGYARPSARPLFWYDGSLTYDSDEGASAEFDTATNILTLSSMDDLSYVTNFSLTVNYNLNTEGFFVGAADRTRDQFCTGNRDIDLTLTLDWCDRAITMYELAESNTPAALRFRLARANGRYIDLLMPGVFFRPFPLPDASGDKSPRSVTVNASVETVDVDNATTGTTAIDMNLVMATSQDVSV